MTNPTVLFLRNVQDFGILNYKSGAQWVILVEAWKTVVLRTMEAWLKMFLEGTIISATGLETISAIFLAKTVTIFCPCPKNLPSAKFKSNRLSHCWWWVVVAAHSFNPSTQLTEASVSLWV